MAARFLRTPLLQPSTPMLNPATNTMSPNKTSPGVAIEIRAPMIDRAIETVDQSNPGRRGGGGATPETIGGETAALVTLTWPWQVESPTTRVGNLLLMSSTYNDFSRTLIEHLRANKGKAPDGPFKDRTLVILTSKGAKSGAEHETPIVYSRDGDKYVIVASKSGAPTNPGWYHNLKAHPEVTVEIGGEKFKAHAREAGDDEYERLYQNHAKHMPAFNEYRQKTTRHIPVMVLERLDSK